MRISRPEPGVCAYNFTVNILADTPVTYSWAMHDDYDVAFEAISAVVDDAQAHLDAKTARMNALFADEVPYFRTSDAVVQQVYYFLFAVNLMYYTHKGAGQLQHPFTQTACLNFRGNHGFDNLMHGRVGAWYATKENYATGNLLIWTALNGSEVGLNGMMPDVAGQRWVSGLGGGFYYHAYPVNAWLVYEHSLDVDFLREVYKSYAEILPRNFWGGFSYEGAIALGKIATALGETETPPGVLAICFIEAGAAEPADRGLAAGTDERLQAWPANRSHVAPRGGLFRAPRPARVPR